MTAVSKSTKILIDNFIGTYFANIPSENREQIKESVIDIADSLLEQNNIQNHINVDNLATKNDLRDEIAKLRNEISKLDNKITESKYDLLKWIVSAQLAIAGLSIVAIQMILKFQLG